MSTASNIEWTDTTWNPVRGCVKVSPGCKHCYAQTFAERWRGLPDHPYGQGFDLRLVPEKIGEPLRWRKSRRIFVNSMSDLFQDGVPVDFIRRVFETMDRAAWHTYQVLTKRADRMRAVCSALPRALVQQPQIWLGVSVEDRKYGVPRIDILRDTPASLRFLSVEPLLEDLGRVDLRGIDWVIVGGESGPGARVCKVSWVRDLVRQCSEAGVPVFVKQLGARPDFVEPLAGGGQSIESMLRHGEYEEDPIILRDRKGGDPAEWPEDLRVRQFPGGAS